MIEFLRIHSGMLLLAAFFVVLAGIVFVGVLSKYQRISGYSFDIAILVTIVYVAIVFGLGALAWWCSAFCFAPGTSRSLAFLGGYSVLQATLGRFVIALLTRAIETWYHL